jgi:hypothetical protein
VFSLFRSRAFAGALATLSALGASACSTPEAASPNAEALPSTQAWQGVYRGPYHIYLDIQTRGSEAFGSWLAVGRRNGTFSGKLAGDRLNISWDEHGGDGESWSGRGYFVFRSRGPAEPEIFGERGFGRSNSGSTWWAVKRPDVPLASDVIDNTSNGDSTDDRDPCSDCDIGEELR